MYVCTYGFLFALVKEKNINQNDGVNNSSSGGVAGDVNDV